MVGVDISCGLIYINNMSIDIKKSCLVHESEIEEKALLALTAKEPFWIGVVMGKVSGYLNECKLLGCDATFLGESGKQIIKNALSLQRDYTYQISRDESIATHNSIASNDISSLYVALQCAAAKKNHYMVGFLASRISSQLMIN